MKNPIRKDKHNFKKDWLLLRSLLLKIIKIRLVQVALVIGVIVFALPFIVYYIYRPIVNPNISYGVTFSDKYAEELGLDWKIAFTQSLDDLGVKKYRLIAYWEDIEAKEGIYDFSNIEWQVQEAQKRDAKVILALGRKVPRWPECFEPEWWNKIEDESIRDYHLMKYLEATVKQLKKYDNIEMWQVENEPFFAFGECKYPIKHNTVQREVSLVRGLDSRPIVIQDSGEGGYWFPSYRTGDYLAISMYRKVWMDYWRTLFKRYVYFQYPLPYWSYRIKALLTFVPADKIIVTEAQAEPWGPGPNSTLSKAQKDLTMSRTDFLSILSYSQKSGFERIYFWGVEWWLYEKDKHDNPFYWDTAKALFN